MNLIERRNIEKWFISNEQFNQLYPLDIQAHAQRHWTPLYVARKAANFLSTEKNARILDIGSGAGKFCLAAAYYKPDALFYGVEQRENLISHSESTNDILHLKNVSFVHGNFTKLDFKKYDHFYFYNSFYENLAGTDKIDDSIDYSGELYNYYNRYLYRELEQKPVGTRIATFHSLEAEIPQGYHVIGTEMNNLLKFWIKMDMKIIR